MEKRIIQIGGNTYKLIFDNFNEGVDIDSLLKIDYSNLIGEIVTFPVILNRFGILLAEAESQVAETKLNMDVYEAKTKEKLRIELAEQNNGKAPTVEALNNAVVSNKAYQAMKRKYIEVVKTRDYINSIFWAVKDKSEKLNKLSLSIQPGDLSDSVIEGRVNNVLVKKTKKVIE
nr:MAG TPA: hypothetical protein [Caudoviricetes sp.]